MQGEHHTQQTIYKKVMVSFSTIFLIYVLYFLRTYVPTDSAFAASVPNAAKKNCFKRTYNLILKNDPSEVYVDILVEDEFKMEIFSELGFVLSNNYYCKFEDKTEKLCNRMLVKIN